ncbi:MAG: tyrosine-type recombinase/integrase [Egibacteraceae bacterium]
MAGHVKRGGKTWYYVVNTGTDANGRRVQRKRRGFRTKRDAERALREVLQDLDAGRYIAPSELTVGEYLEEHWLPAVRHRVRPTTYHHQYEWAVKHHLVPHLGKLRMQELREHHVERLHSELRRGGRVDGRGGLSPKAVRLVHGALRKALNDAVGRYVDRNYAALVSAPRDDRPEMTVWTEEDLSRFLARTAADRLSALWLLLATTGMRRGEALGLKWADVEWPRHGDAGWVSVKRALTLLNSAPHLTMPKTRHGARRIALDPHTVTALRQHREQQGKEREAAAELWQDHGVVFCREDGAPLDPSAVSRRFHALARQAGLPRLTLHGLRHSYATIAIVAGVPPHVLSRRLGHAKVEITLGIYGHLLPGGDQTAAGTVAGRILGNHEDPGEAAPEDQ